MRKTKLLSSIRPDVAGDLAILQALGRHSLLLPTDICALVGRSYGAVIARLQKLREHEFIRVNNTQHENPRSWISHPKALQLAPKGISRLSDIGYQARVPESSKQFIHQLTQSQTAASFEIGARLKNLEHVVIDKTSIPVTFSWKGHTYTDHRLTPDLGPIALGYGNDIYRFVCVEVDCASEPLTSADRQRQAIETKLGAYLTVLSSRLYETVWNIPNLTVLFTTTSKTRMENMRDLLCSMTDKFHNCFRFYLFPTITSGTPQPIPGWAVTETGLSRKET